MPDEAEKLLFLPTSDECNVTPGQTHRLKTTYYSGHATDRDQRERQTNSSLTKGKGKLDVRYVLCVHNFKEK